MSVASSSFPRISRLEQVLQFVLGLLLFLFRHPPSSSSAFWVHLLWLIFLSHINLVGWPVLASRPYWFPRTPGLWLYACLKYSFKYWVCTVKCHVSLQQAVHNVSCPTSVWKSLQSSSAVSCFYLNSLLFGALDSLCLTGFLCELLGTF